MMGRIDNETIRYLFHIVIQQAQQHPDDMQTSPENQGGPVGPGAPGGAAAPVPQRPTPPQASRPGGAAAAMASAAARAAEPPAQRLPDVARQLDRKQQRQQQDLQYQTGAAQAEPPKPVRAAAKVGRNDPCPCGSGKKYKKCHGQGQ